jgi:hypothetical protein
LDNHIHFRLALREEIDYLLTASLTSFEFSGIIAKFPVITHKSSSLVTIEKLWSDHLSSKNNSKKTRRLLWIKGSLGSGKSTLMKEAFLRHPAKGQYTAAFFCDASAKEVRLRSASGMLQSLLYQLLPLCFRGDLRRRDLIDILETKYKRATSAGVQMEWESEELVQLLRTVVSQNSDRDIVLFVDALDQYPENDRIFIIDCLEHLSSKENDIYSRVHIWISSRDQILLVPEDCLSVQIESVNWEDINNYVDEKLKLYPKRNLDEFSKFKVKLKKRSSGNFLWVVLVVDIIRRRMLHAQYNVKSMEFQLGELPERLHELYYTLLQEAHEHRLIRLKFFQWAILSDDLTLEHWQHILPFLGHPVPRTLALCEASEFWEENCTNVGDQVSYLSLGLFRASLPLEEIAVPADFKSEKSMDGTAGSMDSRAGNSRKVRPVHESVRTFFLQYNGFRAVAEAGQSYNLADGYITILHTCLDFVSLEDFDGLVELRRQAFSTDRTRPRSVSSDKLSQKSSRSQSVASFSSASSRHGHWDPSGASTYSVNQGMIIEADSQSQSRISLDNLKQTAKDQGGINTEKQTTDEQFNLWLQQLPYFSQSSRASSNDSDISGTSERSTRLQQPGAWFLTKVTASFLDYCRCLDACGYTPESVIHRLQHEGLWNRWLCLNEIDPVTWRLSDWANFEQLHTWVHYLSTTMESMQKVTARYAGSIRELDEWTNDSISLQYCLDLGDRFIPPIARDFGSNLAASCPKEMDLPTSNSTEKRSRPRQTSQNEYLWKPLVRTYHVLGRALVKDPVTQNYFMPLQQVRRILTPDVIGEVLESSQGIIITPDEIMSVYRSYLRIFAVLIMLDKPETIRLFLEKNIDDDSLPLILGSQERNGGGNPFYMSLRGEDLGLKAAQSFFFNQEQWRFLSPFLTQQGINLYHYKIPSAGIALPITDASPWKSFGSEIRKVRFSLDSTAFSASQVSGLAICERIFRFI